jgi:site-specific DNA recombinase
MNASPMAKRAAVYARYSTDLQKDKSIEDQVAVCRAYAARNGYTIVVTFEDRATSGASIYGRSGIQRLLKAAHNRQFSAVIAESLSRIGRDQEDRAFIRKRLNFEGIDLVTPTDGVVTPMVDGMRAIIDEQYLDDLKRMIRRGMSGLVRAGKNAGGRCYGYRPRHHFENGEVIRGDLEIVESEAEVVRRIFSEYLEGRTPRQIAHDLNRDRVAPPRGRTWNASTINGSPQRGTGLLRNALYVGRLEWNRVRMIKDPDTGKRVSRPNPPDEWQITPVTRLAIVPTDLYEAAQARKAEMTRVQPHKQRAPKRILSGLLRCGCCGGGMSTKGKDKSGRVRLECSNARENGTCPEPRTFYLDQVEDTVLNGLRAELKNPQVLSEYVCEYHAERQRLASKAVRNVTRLERRRGEIDREVERLVNGIAKGIGNPNVLGDRMNEILSERGKIEAQLEAARAKPTVVALLPAALKRYEQQLANLQDSIGKVVETGDQKLTVAIRDLALTGSEKMLKNLQFCF